MVEQLPRPVLPIHFINYPLINWGQHTVAMDVITFTRLEIWQKGSFGWRFCQKNGSLSQMAMLNQITL